MSDIIQDFIDMMLRILIAFLILISIWTLCDIKQVLYEIHENQTVIMLKSGGKS